MTPENWERLKPLFEEALERTQVDRDAFIAGLRADDAALADELSALVTAHLAKGGPLDGPFQNVRQRLGAGSGVSKGDVLMDRYEIVRLIGQGGMGQVFEANDREMGRIALKTIRGDVAGNVGMLSRFRREVKLARLIPSVNVCRVHEFYPAEAVGGDMPVAFLTMEFLEGSTLSDRIANEGPLSTDEAGNIAGQLCAGLQAIHEAGVIHRDFKSRNVMLAPRNGSVHAVITDFGLAREVRLAPESGSTGTMETQPGMVMGTPAYMAPEQFEGKAPTPATDIYALGVVLYEMVTGQSPFSSPTPVAAAVQRGRRPPAVSSIRPGIPRRWDEVIGRCLEYDAALRYQSAAEVGAALSGRRVPKRLGWIAAAVALLLAAVVTAGYLHWSRGSGPSPEARHWYDEGTAALREGTYLKATKALERAVDIDKNFALAHARLADAWTELDFAGKAQEEMVKASEPESSRRFPQIERDYIEAVRATILRDFPAALGRYKAIFGALPEVQKAYGYVDVGRAYEKSGNIAEAVKNYSAAAKLAPEYVAPFVRLGILESRQRHTPESEAAFSRAEKLYRASSNLEGLAEISYQRGFAASIQGDLAQARTLMEMSLQTANAIPSVQLEIRAQLQLSTIEYRSGDIERANNFASQALRAARENGMDYWSTNGLVLLGNAYLTKGAYSEAEKYYTEALRLAEKNGTRRLEAFAKFSLASLRNKQGRPDQVVAYAQDALDYYKSAGFFIESAQAQILIIRAKRDMGDFGEALKSARSLLESAKNKNVPGLTQLAEETVGSLLLRLQRYPEALDHDQAALALARQTGDHPEYQMAHCSDLLWRLGRYREAEQLMQEANESGTPIRDIQIEVDRIGAHIALSQKEYFRAVSLSKKAIEFAGADSRTSDFSLVEGLAELGLGRRSKAVEVCNRSLEMARRAGDREMAAEATLALAQVLSSARDDADVSEAKRVAETAHAYFHEVGKSDSDWHSLLVIARTEAKLGRPTSKVDFAKKGMDILSQMEHNWGSQNYQLYVTRPDVRGECAELVRLALP